MFHITKSTLSDRIHPIEFTNIRIKIILSILWPRQILQPVKVRVIRQGKEPRSLTTKFNILFTSYKPLILVIYSERSHCGEILLQTRLPYIKTHKRALYYIAK